MIQWFKSIFGIGPSVDPGELIRNGAQIIDVRTAGEFQGGHIKGALNIPLNMLSGKLPKIRKDKPIVTCCASGVRSAAANRILKANGFTDVHNGGGWHKLKRYVA